MLSMLEMDLTTMDTDYELNFLGEVGQPCEAAVGTCPAQAVVAVVVEDHLHDDLSTEFWCQASFITYIFSS